MAIIINDPYARGGGAEAGKQFGDLLSTSLQKLAQTKMQNMEKRQQASQLMPLVGGNSQLANLLAGNPKLQQEYFKQQWAPKKGMQTLQQPQAISPQQAQLAQAILPQSPQQIPEQAPEQAMAEMSQQRQPMTREQALQQVQEGHALNPEQAVQEMIQEKQAKPKAKAKATTKTELAQETENMKMQQPWEILQIKPRGKEQLDIYKIARAQQDKIEKTLNPRMEKLELAANAAKKDKFAFNTLKQAVKSGKLTSASWARFRHSVDKNAQKVASGIGAAIGAIGGAVAGGAITGVGALPGAYAGGTAGEKLGSAIGAAIPKFVGSELDQVFNKTVYGFMRNAKDIFGARIPVAEMEMFIQTLPTLQMDDQAKMAIIDQMEAMGNLAEAQQKAKNDIIKEHGGHAPANLFELVNERTESYTQQIADQLSSTIKKLIEEQASDFSTVPSMAEIAKKLKKS